MDIIRTDRVSTRLIGSLALAAVVALSIPAFAQDARPSAATPSGVVSRFPTDRSAERDRLASEMLASGEAGIAAITRQLVPAGSGNDTAVRFAVNALAVYASQAGAEQNRALAERALVNALPSTSDVEVRTFLLSQLRLVGRDAAVRAATADLSDAALVEPATQLMLSVRSAAARAALVAALGRATGAAQITIVKAIGELKAVEALSKLTPFARDANPVMRKQALAALARIASPKSYATLAEAAQAAQFRYEPTNAVGALMEYAAQLSKNRAGSAAEKVCKLVLKSASDDGSLQTKAAALRILTDVRGAKALPELLKAIDHGDRAYRNAALLSAEPLRGTGPARQWIAKAGKVDPVRQAEIITMLGRQADPAALPFVRTSLGAADPTVALAAADALAHIERAKAVPDLLALLKTAPAESAARVADTLNWTIDEQHLDPLVAMLDALQPAAKAAAIGIIGKKAGRRFAGRILPLTSDGNALVRTAAIGALQGVATPSDLPALFTLLDGVESDGIAPVQKAVVAAASQITPEASRAAPLIQAMKTSSHTERIIEVLPQVGGTQALSTTIAQFELTSNPVIQAAAFRALTRWPGSDATDKLFAIFTSGADTYRNQAFSAFVRQVGAAAIPDDQKVLKLKKALAQASTVGDRRILLRAFDRIKTFESFLAAASLLDNAEVASEAATAVMHIVLPASGKRDGFTGTLVRNALEKALQAIKGAQSEGDKESIRAYLAAMPKDEGGEKK